MTVLCSVFHIKAAPNFMHLLYKHPEMRFSVESLLFYAFLIIATSLPVKSKKRKNNANYELCDVVVNTDIDLDQGKRWSVLAFTSHRQNPYIQNPHHVPPSRNSQAAESSVSTVY